MSGSQTVPMIGTLPRTDGEDIPYCQNWDRHRIDRGSANRRFRYTSYLALFTEPPGIDARPG